MGTFPCSYIEGVRKEIVSARRVPGREPGKEVFGDVLLTRPGSVRGQRLLVWIRQEDGLGQRRWGGGLEQQSRGELRDVSLGETRSGIGRARKVIGILDRLREGLVLVLFAVEGWEAIDRGIAGRRSDVQGVELN